MMNINPLDITIVGTGYVGLTTAVALAHIGHNVIGIDKDLEKINILGKGESPIHEAHLGDILRSTHFNLKFSSDLSKYVGDSQIIIIAVGTPSKANGEADTQYVENAALEIAENIVHGQRLVIVIKSTVPIGSNHRVKSVVMRNLKRRGVEATVFFASNPEFLREGMALHDTFYPDRIVIGTAEEEAIYSIAQMYRPILEQTFTPPKYIPRPSNFPLPTLVTTDTTSAEMIKYASNAFLATKISFINEISGLCEKVGADITEVSRGMGLDTRIGNRFLSAGLGWGGSCFPKDTKALQSVAAQYGYEMPIIQATRSVNESQRLAVIEKLQRVLHVVRGRTITILGLAFKPGTDDVRDSASIDIIRLLLERGAHIKAHDPIAIRRAQNILTDLDVEWCEDPVTSCIGADAILLATEWDEYRNLDWRHIFTLVNNRAFIDGRNFLNPLKMRQIGFRYIGIGIPEDYIFTHTEAGS